MTTTRQAPIRSGFGAETTAQEVIGDRRLDGTTAVVTGGYAGVGLATTRALVGAGATVIVPARNVDKARAALSGLPRVEVDAMDLADPPTIDAFAARLGARPVDLLINNAGIMATPLARDARGFDMQLATNHLGHFQLTVRLLPALGAARQARVVALSSRGHARSAFDFDDPRFEQRPYDKWIAYGQSKTANALFAVALDARTAGHGIRAFAVHPGAVLTELGRSVPAEELRAIRAALPPDQLYKTIEQGAATSVWCATSPQLAGMGGVYCEDCDVAEAVPADFKGLSGVRPWAIDRDAAERLWHASEAWTGVRFAIDELGRRA
jgi:NAD(P)-dependent dehydrogenase (short-subunit alcohol dehydrogenase family)